MVESVLNECICNESECKQREAADISGAYSDVVAEAAAEQKRPGTAAELQQVQLSVCPKESTRAKHTTHSSPTQR